MNDCIFCSIIRGEAPSWKVYEDEDTFAFLSIHPAAPYHTLVIPKKHRRDIFDVSEDEMAAVARTVKRLASIYQEKLGVRNLQVINSSGAEAQQDVFHIHFHLLPRSAGDGQDITWKTHPETQDEFDQMLSRLSEN